MLAAPAQEATGRRVGDGIAGVVDRNSSSRSVDARSSKAAESGSYQPFGSFNGDG
jgi:hypothetical protein